MDPEGFRAATNVSRETLDRLRLYDDLLRHWQRRVNLVGQASLEDGWRRHFLDSAQLIPLVPHTARIITDIGSGAGFPGLVLAIISGLETHLVESDGRKAAFLREAARRTGTAAHIHNARIETLAPWPTDVISARALAPLPRLLELATRFPPTHPPEGCVFLFLKGAGAEEELTEAENSWQMHKQAIRSVSGPEGHVLRIWDVKKR